MRIEIRGCAIFAGAAPPSADARTHARTHANRWSRWKDGCAANESVKGACFHDDLARLERKNCWQFRSKGESCSIVITFRIAILPSGSLNSFPGRSIRGEENRHRGGNFSFVRESPLAGSDRNGRKRSNQRVSRFAGMRIYIYIYLFRFPPLFHSRFRFLPNPLLSFGKELSNQAPLVHFF